ncbi:hypothetical protein BJX99DRAFT_258200 [Aspergillus californicus]
MEDLAQAGLLVVILNEPTFPLPANVDFSRANITLSDNIRADHGNHTVLVNNAGVGHDGTMLDEPEAKIQQTFEVNIISHFWMVHEFLPNMVKNNHGHVITIASMASFVALGEMAEHCASKAGVLVFHGSLLQELQLWYNAPKVPTRHVALENGPPPGEWI